MRKIYQFSLVTTTFNEINNVDHFISDMEKQTVIPDEIVIVDGGSFDGTFEELINWAGRTKLTVKVLQRKEYNIAEGRNFAIENSAYDLIVSTDMGCRFKRNWISNLLKPFYESNAKVVGGNFTIDTTEIITNCQKADYILSNFYNYKLEDGFIPSSRSIAYFKDVWIDVNRYPEFLTLAADDLVFGFKILKKGYDIKYVQNRDVIWNRPKKCLDYGKEARRYALGDGEAEVNKRQFISKILRLLSILIAISFIIGTLFNISLIIYAPIFLIAVFWGFRSYYMSVKRWLKVRSDNFPLSILLSSFLLIEITNLNYIYGYMKGYFFKSRSKRIEAKKLKKWI